MDQQNAPPSAMILEVPATYIGKKARNFKGWCQECMSVIVPQSVNACPGCDTPVVWKNSNVNDKQQERKENAEFDRGIKKKRISRRYGRTATFVLELARSTWPSPSEVNFREFKNVSEAKRIESSAKVYGEDAIRELVRSYVSNGEKGRGIIAHLMRAIDGGFIEGGKQTKPTEVIEGTKPMGGRDIWKGI